MIPLWAALVMSAVSATAAMIATALACSRKREDR